MSKFFSLRVDHMLEALFCPGCHLDCYGKNGRIHRDVPVYPKFESYLQYSYKCLCIGMHVLHTILKNYEENKTCLRTG